MKMMKVAVLAVAIAGTALLLQGCYEEQQVVLMPGELVPMTQQDVIAMVQDGVPDSEIIREIRASGSGFRLSANEVTYLRSQGVSAEVIDYMLSARGTPAAVVTRTVVVERPPVLVYEPLWGWDSDWWPDYYYSYPWHIGLSFSYAHFGRHSHYRGYGVHVGHWR